MREEACKVDKVDISLITKVDSDWMMTDHGRSGLTEVALP